MQRAKIILGIIAILSICTAFNLKPKTECAKKVSVSGTVMHTGVFCGGMRISDERLEEIKKPKVFANKKLFVKKGTKNDLKKKPVLEFVSDSSGNFSFSLPPGEYCIVEELKKDKKNYDKLLNEYKTDTKNFSAISPTCLAEWFKTPDAVLTVTKSAVTNFTITFQNKCKWKQVPCVTYRGPMPN
ncbi:MAG: hypothetical protein V4608_05745 [Bacteroidota bacterium]